MTTICAVKQIGETKSRKPLIGFKPALLTGLRGWLAGKASQCWVLVVGAMLQAFVCEAQNLVQNPGFENGSTAGWFAYGPATISVQTGQAYSGAYAALVQNRTATWNGIAQTMQGIIQPGQTCSVSTWIRIASGTNQTVQLTMQKMDGGGTTYSAIASGSVSSTGWTQLSGQYTLTVSGTLTGLTFYVEVPTSTSASFYVDDVVVQALDSMPPGTNTGVCTVNWTNVYQRIDGFGASSAWRSSWSSSVANQFFSTNTGIGLSLLRTRIAPDGTSVENSLMQMARDRGAKVWSTPWSPPTVYKTTNSVNGGYFVSSAANYQGYASQLARYVVNIKNTYGVTIHALSVQNEPNYITTYESCGWSAQQIHDFIPYLSATLAASNVASTKIILPESASWVSAPGLYTTTMTDANTAPLVSVIASHNYVGDNNAGDQTAPAALNSYGAALWETEVSTFDTFDGSITNGIYWAERIHAFLTIAQVNAWHYWWLSGANNEGLASNSDVLAKRAYVVGQYSRFVRPDYYRIGVVTNLGAALVSAFKDPASGQFAIVAINPGTDYIDQTFSLTNFGAVSVPTPWVTSSAQSLASQAAVMVSNSTIHYLLPPMSVVTLVGQVTNGAPVFGVVSNRIINVGINVSITNSVTDPDLLGQTLTFTLLAAPTNATLTSLNASNTLFTWRPFIAQAASTNLIQVKVTDSGTPALSATNNFVITVNPASRPALSFITAGSQVSLSATGMIGPDYSLFTSTNLTAWQFLFTTNPIAMPVTFTDTNRNDAARFYRLQLGP